MSQISSRHISIQVGFIPKIHINQLFLDSINSLPEYTWQISYQVEFEFDLLMKQDLEMRPPPAGELTPHI